MVAEREVDAATVDSVALEAYKLAHPQHAHCFHRLLSLGPLPIYPIVFNTRLPGKSAPIYPIVPAHLPHRPLPIYPIVFNTRLPGKSVCTTHSLGSFPLRYLPHRVHHALTG